MTLADYIPVLAIGATTVATAAVGYGELRAKVGVLRRDVDTKASSDVVNAHYGEIIRRLDRIERISDKANIVKES